MRKWHMWGRVAKWLVLQLPLHVFRLGAIVGGTPPEDSTAQKGLEKLAGRMNRHPANCQLSLAMSERLADGFRCLLGP